MYDYETIKKNFENISEKDKLNYREMCEFVGDKFATSSVLRKRQMDKWKQFISWKQNNKKQFTKIKICSEEEAIENIFEKCMTDSLGYTLSAFLVLYTAYSNGKTRIHTSYSELAKAFGMFNEDFNLARFNLPETEFNCETELLGLRNDRYEGLEDMKKAIRQARKNNPNALSTKNHKSVQDFFTRYARNANSKIETVLNKFKKDKVLNYSETYCGAFFDAEDKTILAHLKDIYLNPKDKAYYYDIVSKNEKGEDIKTSIFVPYKDRIFVGDEESIYLSIQNKCAHDLGYQNYGEALSFGKGKEIDKLSEMCKPSDAVITNIGTAHIGNLGSKKNIFKAKMEIINGMNNGNLFVNGYDDYLKKIKKINNINIIKVGLDKKLFIKEIKEDLYEKLGIKEKMKGAMPGYLDYIEEKIDQKAERIMKLLEENDSMTYEEAVNRAERESGEREQGGKTPDEGTRKRGE